jgi:hypothetical protein
MMSRDPAAAFQMGVTLHCSGLIVPVDQSVRRPVSQRPKGGAGSNLAAGREL